MAIKGAIPMRHGDAFSHGCFVVGEVQAMRDFDRSTREQAVQAVDREARERTVRVKITAPVQPVPPAAAAGVPFRPVEFEGLTATPYVATTATGRGRLTWSFRATGMQAPKSVPAMAGDGKAG
jgi:hypothetical protein